MRKAFAAVVGMLGFMLGCSHSDGGSSSGSSQPTVALGEMKSGEGTYYDFANGDGACMFGPSPDAMDIAALNKPDWSGSSLCGACAEVTGPKGSVTIRIVDQCPECKTGDLDFSPQAFGKIADMAAGRVPISWKLVTCDVSGPIQYKYKDGANQWWTAVQVRNHRLPVTSLEFSRDDGDYQAMERQDYNYFLTDSGFGPDAVRVRVTAMDGQTLEDDLPPVQAELVVSGKAQFR
jgi:expansin (peptidoglycan-binding protein)